jgi:hypothetical protein
VHGGCLCSLGARWSRTRRCGEGDRLDHQAFIFAGNATTPLLASRWGSAAVSRVHGVLHIAVAVIWQLVAQYRPVDVKRMDVDERALSVTIGHQYVITPTPRTQAEGAPTAVELVAETDSATQLSPLSLRDLLRVPACRGLFALTLARTCTSPFGDWDPIYHKEIYMASPTSTGAYLGLLRLGSTLSNAVMAGVETTMMRARWPTLHIRRSCSSMAYALSVITIALYTSSPTALLATLACFIDSLCQQLHSAGVDHVPSQPEPYAPLASNALF